MAKKKLNTVRPDLKAPSDERKRLSVDQGLAPVPPPEVPALAAPAAAEQPAIQPTGGTVTPRSLDANYLQPGTPEYSDAYVKARDAFENTADPNTTKIGPNLRRDNTTGKDIRFPGPGEWQPDPDSLWGQPKPSPPEARPNPDQIASVTDATRAKLELMQGTHPGAWKYQAHIASHVQGSSDTPPTVGPDGTYADWFEQRWNGIQRDIALDGLMRPQFDQIAADNPIAAANGQHIGDTWRTVKALTPPMGAPPAPPEPTEGQKPKGKATQPDATVGLPWGKQYPSVEAMFRDWVSGAAGAANELLGIKPAKGETLDEILGIKPAEAQPPRTARPPQPGIGTPNDALQYLTNTKGASPPQTKGPLDATLQVLDQVMKQTETEMREIPANLVFGAYTAVKVGLDSIDSLTSAVASAAGNLTGIDALKEYAKGGLGIPDAPPPNSVIGGFTRSAAQFMVGFALAGQALQGLGWAAGGGLANQGAQFVTKGAIADAAFFTGQTGKLADLLVEVPALKNPVTEFLATNPNDSEAEGRFKNALNGIIATPLIPAFVLTVRGLRGAARLTGMLKGAQSAADAGGAGAVKPTVVKSLLGDVAPDAPLTAAADPTTGKLAIATKEVAASGYTPIGGGPAGSLQVFVNFAAIKTGDDIQGIVNETVAAFEGTTDEARRGVVSWQQTKTAAGDLDAFNTLMARRTGEAPNAAQVYAWTSLYEAAARKTQEVAAAVQRAPLSEAPQAMLEARQMASVFLAIQKELYGARAEAGRAVNAFKIPRDSPDYAKQVEAVLNQYGGMDANMEWIKKVASINDPNALQAFIEKSTFTKLKDAATQVYYFNVLSSFKTQIRNAVGNMTMLGLNMAETGFAAQMSRLMGDDAVRAGEATAQLYGIKASFVDALRAAGKTWRTGEAANIYGVDKLDYVGARENAITSKTWELTQKNSMLGLAADALGALTQTTGKALLTSDQFFRTVGQGGTAWQAAFKQVQNEIAAGRLKPEGITDRMTTILSDWPNYLTSEAIADVTAKASYLTFTNPPVKGGATDILLKLRDLGSQEDASIGGKIYNFIARTTLPFVNTPSQIFQATLERTPLAPITSRYRDAIRQGGAAAYQGNARMALSSMLMATYVDLAMNGQITGGGPKNKAKYDTMYATGWRPWSFKVGDNYVSYQGTGPFSIILGWGAQLGEILTNTDVGDPTAADDYERATVAALFAGSEVALSQSYLSQTADFVDLLNGGAPGALEAYFKRWGAGLVVPNIVRDIETVVDPAQRYTTDVFEEIRNRIPGLSADLPERRDAFGFVMDYRSGFGAAYDAISPFYAKQIKNMPIAAAMLKDGWAIGVPSMTITVEGTALDIHKEPEIFSRFLELRGQVKPSALTAKVMPNYSANDRYASGEAAQAWSDRLKDRYSDRNMVETLNGIVSESPPSDLRDLAERYHSLPNAETRKQFILDIKDTYQDAAKAVLFFEYPELLARARLARSKAAGQGAQP